MNHIEQSVDAPARSGGTEKIMSSVPAWFERNFEFSFPCDQYPNLCVRLWGTPARLEEMLHRVAREVLVRKLGEKWSAQEHAGHLLDLESLWSARVTDFLTGNTELATADLSNRKTHEANHNARRTGEILADFRSARMQLLNRVSKLEREVFSRSMLHPRLKQPMRLVDHLFFAAEHDDHHLAKIWELILGDDGRSDSPF
jgi:uncharacterized damage-inducible protein DinB